MQPAQRVARGEDVSVDLLVPAGQEGRVGTEDAHQGDHPGARALRLPPRARDVAPRRPSRQRQARRALALVRWGMTRLKSHASR